MSRDAKTCAQWIREYPGDVPVRVALAVSNILDRKRRSAKVIKLGRMKPSRESKAEARRGTRALVEARENVPSEEKPLVRPVVVHAAEERDLLTRARKGMSLAEAERSGAPPPLLAFKRTLSRRRSRILAWLLDDLR